MRNDSKILWEVEIQMRKIVCYDALGILGITKRPKEKLFATVMPKVYPVNLIVSNRTKWFPVDGESYAQDRGGEDSAESTMYGNIRQVIVCRKCIGNQAPEKTLCISRNSVIHWEQRLYC